MNVITSHNGAWGPQSTIYGKDGRTYPTIEAARAADHAYDLQMGNRTSTSMTVGGKSSGGAGSGNYTQEFLKKWGDINDQVLSTLNGAINDIGSGKSMYPGSEQLQGLISDIGQQSKDFSQKYGGVETSSINSAMNDINARNDLTNQFMDLSKPDYAGVAGRASADVRASTDKALAENTRQAMSYGVDPTSGKFGALTQKSYLDQARNEAMAMNVARTGEKNRVSDMAAKGLSLIDPSKSYGIAKDIAATKAGLTNQEANLQLADTNANNQAMQLKGALAGKVADIGSQYGSAGMTMLGLENAKAEAGTNAMPYNSVYGDRTTTSVKTPMLTPANQRSISVKGA